MGPRVRVIGGPRRRPILGSKGDQPAAELVDLSKTSGPKSGTDCQSRNRDPVRRLVRLCEDKIESCCSARRKNH
jgi:hypothetical protein